MMAVESMELNVIKFNYCKSSPLFD